MSAKTPPSNKLHHSDAANESVASGSDESEPSMLSRNQEGDWVDDSLRKLYTSTLEEDIPMDMLSLLDQLDDAVEANADADKSEDKEAQK